MKSTFWGGLIGGLIVIMSLLGIAFTLSEPIQLVRVATVGVISSALWAGFGGFLIWIYFKHKRNEEKGATVKPEPDSPEDKERLEGNQSWILGFVLLVSFLFSVETWLLNDYLAGFTPINIFVTFDLILNLVLFYFVIQLFSKKDGVLKPLLYVITFYTLVESALYLWRGYWFSAVSLLGFIVYFAYAILAPTNRHTYRIAHLVMLPLMIVLFVGLSSLDDMGLNKTSRDGMLVEQQYVEAIDQVNIEYGQYLEKDIPTADDIRDVQAAGEKMKAKSGEYLLVLDELEEAAHLQVPSVAKETALDYFGKLRAITDLQIRQTDELSEMMKYAATVNFNALSDAQIERLNEYEGTIDELGEQITVIQFEIDNASE